MFTCEEVNDRDGKPAGGLSPMSAKVSNTARVNAGPISSRRRQRRLDIDPTSPRVVLLAGH